MPPIQPVEVVNESSLVLEILKLVIPGLIGLAGVLAGVWVTTRAAAKTARMSWERDAKREGYLRLFPAVQELGDQAGLIVRAGREGDGPALEAAQERYRMAFASLSAAVVVARITASPDSEAAISQLVTYARRVLNPFLNEGVPDVLRWKTEIERELLARLEALETAARSDLETGR